MNELEQVWPSVATDWLSANGYRTRMVEPITGGYAATLYRLEVNTPTGAACTLVYKRLTSERQAEWVLYQTVLRGRTELIPHVVACLQSDTETGILMQDEGPTLKSVLAPLDPLAQRPLLEQAATWLADLHVHYEHHVAALVVQGLQPTYPIASAASWSEWAIEELHRLCEDACAPLLDVSQVRALDSMRAWFYPRYPRWLAGRCTLTHGDPHHENLLVAHSGFRLIDWEATCVAVPQRDLAIFLQDILDESLHAAVTSAYFNHLQANGWKTTEPSFLRSFAAVFFDNTLMMLGWEVHKYYGGYLSQEELARIMRVKLHWLAASFAQLQDDSLE